MNNPPLLTLIITAHNSASYLEDTLKSVINALDDAVSCCEFMLTNDNSTDNTHEIIERFANHHANCKFFNLKFGNIGKVRNFAISQSRGKYILMIDGDDLLLEKSLPEKVKILQEKSPDILICKLTEIKENDKLFAHRITKDKFLSSSDALKRYLIHRDFQAHTAGQFFKREIIASVPYPEFTCYEDSWVFPLILYKCKKIIFSRNSFYFYIKRPGSLSSKIGEEKINYLFQTLENMDKKLPSELTNLISCHWLDLFNRHRDEMSDKIILEKTKKRISAIPKWSFLSDFSVRISYKRKYLKLIKQTN